MDRCISVEMAIKHLLEKAVAKFPASFYLGLFAAVDELKKLPAADVRPVVYGEWEIVEEKINEIPCGGSIAIRHRRCSVCKQPMGFQKENFCGNCGADMKGEDDEQKH